MDLLFATGGAHHANRGGGGNIGGPPDLLVYGLAAVIAAIFALVSLACAAGWCYRRFKQKG